jgi:hypothetical protein
MKMIMKKDSIQTITSKKQIIQRKIHLKGQALKLIRTERDELKTYLFLLDLKARLESQMTEQFHADMSKRLDCVIALLDSMEAHTDGK